MSRPTIDRLCRIYGELLDLDRAGKSHATSRDLARAIGATGASVRRDINNLGILGPSRSGYPVDRLRRLIGERLGLEESLRTCVIGLDWIGEALVRTGSAGRFSIVAGFDGRINRLETMEAVVPLFPVYELESVVRQRNVSLAIIAAGDPADYMESLRRSGIRGVLNMTPSHIEADDLTVVNVAIVHELRTLAALLSLSEPKEMG